MTVSKDKRAFWSGSRTTDLATDSPGVLEVYWIDDLTSRH
jgi:hypothetical protein